MESNPGIDVLGTNFFYEHKDGKVFNFNFLLPQEHSAIKFMLPFVNIYVHSTMMFRKDSLIDNLRYNYSLSYGADYSLWLDFMYNSLESNINSSSLQK